MDRYLVLENGAVFKGQAFGADKEVVAEVVFTTGMVAYLETLTDPSYYGQAIVQTFPLIGNYGITPEDAESDMNGASAYIVREWCEKPSNFRSQGEIDSYLKQAGIPGLCGIDTRALTRIIREKGVMNGAITADPAKVDMEALRAYRVTGAVDACSTKEIIEHKAENERFRVVLMDFGMKANIARMLLKRGCSVTVVPARTTAAEILAMKPDGIMLSNGPGDPAENTFCVEQIRKMMGRAPIFGICLGHQLTALAAGGRTVKLKYGHRGANQPVKDLRTGRTYITSQNHGYAAVAESVPAAWESFRNANDGTCEGLEYPGLKCFTVQFHPEARSGPRDTEFLFDRFIAMMEEDGHA